MDGPGTAGARSFVGRDLELEVLLGAVAGLGAGRGSLFLVSGEPGIGKTRLADEFCGRAAAGGAVIAWGSAWDGGGAPACWPWIQVLRALRPRLPDPDQRLRRDLGPLWDDATGPAGDVDLDLQRFRRFDALRAVLTAASGRAPLAIVLDDLHAADAASLLGLEFVARSLRSLPAVIVGTHREAEARLAPEIGALLSRVARQGRSLRLSRLGRHEVARLMADLEPVTPALVDEIYRASGGNPLFVGEALRLVRSGARGRQVPDQVSAIIEARLAGFDPPARQALEAAAVLGRETSSSLLADVLDLPAAALQERTRLPRLSGVLESMAPGRVRFGHPLYRERLLAELDPERRAALHLRAAQAHQRGGAPGEGAVEEAVAGHLLAALPGGDRCAAADWASRAGDRAMRALAFDGAVTFFEGALAALEGLAPDPARHIDLELRLAEALARTGAAERGRAVCRDAAARARGLGDAPRLARAALGYGAELRIGVVDATLVSLLEEALGALGASQDRLRARLMARLAAARQPAPDPRAPMDLAREAVALARRTGDAEALLSALDHAGSAFGTTAPPEERVGISRQLASAALAGGDLLVAQRAYGRLAIDAAELCDLEEFDLAVDAHARLGAALGHPRWRWRSAVFRSMRALIDGRWADSERAQEEAAATAAQGDDPFAASCLAVHRIGALRARDAGTAADYLALAAGAPASAGPHRPETPMAQAIRASTMARAGELEAARRVSRTLPLEDLRQLPVGLAALADVAMRVGDAERAAEILPLLRAVAWPAMTWGMVGLIWDGPTARWIGGLLAVLDRRAEAVEALEDAFGTATSVAARPVAAQIGAELAEALLRRAAGDDRRRAAALLDQAAGEAAALGMTLLAARVARTRSGAAVRPGVPAAAAAGFELSRQGEVWAVTSGGRTVRLRHSRALEILDQLVRHPGREFHVLDLGAVAGEAVDPGDAGAVLDAGARQAYRRRVQALEEELRQAETWNDAGRRERLGAELDFLREELARAAGLGGRSRRTAGAVERARVNVQKRLRGVIRRIGGSLPELARHLEAEVRTGVLVSYRRNR